MHVVENSIDIARPVEAVFDYCSDMRTEVDWNPAVKTIELVSDGPVGRGSRFVGSYSGLGKATMEVVEFARPTTWTTTATEASLPFRLIGTVAEGPSGSSRLTMRIELMPRGLLARVFAPLRAIMQRTAKGDLNRIKAALEAG
ncbi:SRPBCC family protein [Pseudonocardia humida]|uniref:SRPBCC family protein n=1 Tax=Pseudonocardia humida TaxID=2800819 RepID=A0ABT0ZX49_9PSEU|nr:SRPBCC family protein [Pseudonocardia humida]MCO1655296.1 SRPBCC family protein [Pseudonocardia humida]